MRHRRHLNGNSNAAAPVATSPLPTGWGSGRSVPVGTSSSPKELPSRSSIAISAASATTQARVEPARPSIRQERRSGAATARRPQTAQLPEGRDAVISSRTTRRVQSARGDGEGRYRAQQLQREPGRVFTHGPEDAADSLPRLPNARFPQASGVHIARVSPPSPRKPAPQITTSAIGTDPAFQVQWAVKVTAASSDDTASHSPALSTPSQEEPPELGEFRRLLRDRYDGKRSIRQAFLSWDSDKDGHICPRELRDMLVRLGFARALGRDKMEAILQHVSTLPEGSLRYEDFCGLICRPGATARRASSTNAVGKEDNNCPSHRPRQAARVLQDPEPCVETADPEQVVSLLRKKYESRKLRQVFRDWDMDKDGGVTLLELEDNLRRQGLRLSKPKLQELFDAHDLDHDGRLLYHEFAKLVLGPIDEHRHSGVRVRQRRQEGQEQQQNNASGATADKDTYLCLRSTWVVQPSSQHANDPGFRATVQRKLRAFAPRLNDAYAAFDDDHSGNLSYGEFRQGLQDLGMHFSEREFLHLATSVDTDGSGEISFKEFCQVFLEDNAGVQGQPAVKKKCQEDTDIGRARDLNTSRRRRTAGTFDFSHLTRRTKIPTRCGRTPIHNTKELISGIQGDATNSMRFATEAQVYGNSHCARGSSAPVTAMTTLGQEEKQRRDAGNNFRLQRLRAQLEQHHAKTSILHNAYEEAQDRRTQTLHRHQTRYHQRIEEQQPRHPLAPGGKSMRTTRPSSAATAAPFL